MSVDGERHGEAAMLAVAAGLGAVATGVLVLALGGAGRIANTPVDVPWLWLVVAFGACEAFGLRVERRQGEQYGFTAALVPLAAGLVYTEPGALVAARLLGVAVVLLVVRQRRPAEAAYELSIHLAQTVAAVVVVRAVLGDSDPVGLHGGVSVGLALAASYAVSSVALAVLIATVSRGLPGWRMVGALARTDLPSGGLNAAIGIALALALWNQDRVAVQLLLVAIVLACIASNRVYSRLYERRRGLEALRDFITTVVRSADMAEIASSVLGAARSFVRADDAVLLIDTVTDGDPGRRYAVGPDGIEEQRTSLVEHRADIARLVPDGVPCRVAVGADAPAWLRARTSVDALAAPITAANGSVLGALVVTHARRKAASHFGDNHARLLGELAEQASLAIENGLLFMVLEHEAAERAHEALHDPLTGLPNRARITEVIEESLQPRLSGFGRVGLIVVDLDSFNQVVDAFGHSSADGLLVQVSGRMRHLLPESAALGRLGGDQFVVVMPNVADTGEVVAAARLLMAGFDPPFQSEGVLLALPVNIGLAVYPDHAVDGQSLMQRSLIAADAARRHHSGWEVYDPMNDPATPRRLALGADLREAIESDDLDVCFQPKVELASGVVRGAEALVRWTHPRLGRVRPDEFITIAEHTGDIRSLTMVVMRKALDQCRSWRDLGIDLSVAVNLSARNLLDLHLVDDVDQALRDSGVPFEALTLELTESMVMSESQRSLDVLSGLAKLGVRLSCDDFGTGYSSLAHLRRLPIGEIKIDQSFIVSMTVDDSDRAIARSVLALGRDLGLTTVAEGVESREAWDLLTSLGCGLAQGYIVCPPLTPRQFREWLDRREPHELATIPEVDEGPATHDDPSRTRGV
ncbi:MAG TPA: GGDEF domain-containing protein [Acidimicrobiales bacterium]|nr:GGDEF domain-containing protein [Acidimicrobiales bacterium]